MAYDVVVVDERIACVSDTVREPPPSEKPEVYHRELPHGFPRLTKVRQDLPSVLKFSLPMRMRFVILLFEM